MPAIILPLFRARFSPTFPCRRTRFCHSASPASSSVGRQVKARTKKLARNKRELRGGLVNRKRTPSSRRRLRRRCMHGIFPSAFKAFRANATIFSLISLQYFFPFAFGSFVLLSFLFTSFFFLHLIFIRPSGLSLTTCSTRRDASLQK